jgi:hypothetical protein
MKGGKEEFSLKNSSKEVGGRVFYKKKRASLQRKHVYSVKGRSELK